MAFFPCIYFESLQMCYYSMECRNTMSKPRDEQYRIVFDRIDKRNKFHLLLYKLYAVCDLRGLRLIIENPGNHPHYLISMQNFPKPTFIDKNRRLRGDYFIKPTAYWFLNITPTNGKSYYNNPIQKIVSQCKGSPTGGICSKERSELAPEYARNFICDFILGKKQANTISSLF